MGKSRGITNNITYLITLIILSVAVYFLNKPKIIYQCSAAFAAAAAIVTYMYRTYGKNKSIWGMIIAVFLNIAIYWKVSYRIDTKEIEGLITMSLLSTLVAVCSGVLVFNTTKRYVVYGFYIVSFAALVDCTIMAIFFTITSNLSSAKVLDIFIRELYYKNLFGLLIYSIIAIIFVIKKNINTLQKDS